MTIRVIYITSGSELKVHDLEVGKTYIDKHSFIVSKVNYIDDYVFVIFEEGGSFRICDVDNMVGNMTYKEVDIDVLAYPVWNR